MKTNHCLCLMGLLAVAVSGCATYHGPATASIQRLPPTYWDSYSPRTSLNVPNPAVGLYEPYDRPVKPIVTPN